VKSNVRTKIPENVKNHELFFQQRLRKSLVIYSMSPCLSALRRRQIRWTKVKFYSFFKLALYQNYITSVTWLLYLQWSVKNILDVSEVALACTAQDLLPIRGIDPWPLKNQPEILLILPVSWNLNGLFLILFLHGVFSESIVGLALL
jgi:hypothetical protein